MRNNSVKLFEFGQWVRCCLNDLLSVAMAALLFSEAEQFMQI